MRLAEIYECFCDETRLRILNLLLNGALCGSHLQEVLDLPQVTVSKHLGYLRERKIVETERCRNWMIYRLPRISTDELRYNLRCLERCRASEPQFQQDLASLIVRLPHLRFPEDDKLPKREIPCRTLFLCSGNSTRSILAEYLLKHTGAGRFEAFSAGTRPARDVKPLTLALLEKCYDIRAADARCKNWDEFASFDLDLVITLCDDSRDAERLWRGNPITAHWAVPSPTALGDDEAARFEAIRTTAAQIESMIRALLATDLAQPQLLLEHRLRAIRYQKSPQTESCLCITGKC